MSAVAAPGTPSAAVADHVRVPDADRRFYAFALDRMIAWGIDLAVAVVVSRFLISQGRAILGVLVIVATVLLVGLVFALMQGATGTTPGKSLLGLRVVHTGTGAPLGAGPGVLRTFVLGVAALPFGFGLAALAWTALADITRLGRGWHDHLVSSIVVDTRPLPVVEEVEEPGPRHVVNLTALRLAPAGPTPPAPEPAPEPASVPPRVPSRPRPAATWGLMFDTGERVVVDTLVLVGRRPEPRTAEQGARLVALGSADMSVSKTHAQVVVAPDGALVVTDRGSTNGSTLVRKGMPRPLASGRPTTLLEGDVVNLGDRAMTVIKVERGRAVPA